MNTYLSEVSRYVEYLSKLSVEELEGIETGIIHIDFVLKREQKHPKRNDVDTVFEPSFLIDSLNEMSAREEGVQFIEKQNLNNQQLGAILKTLDVPYLKKDSKAKMIDKIIESTIGYRLRSSAIQEV